MGARSPKMRRSGSRAAIYAVPPPPSPWPFALATTIAAAAMTLWAAPWPAPWLRAAVAAYVLAEVAFFVYGRARYVALNAPIQRGPDPARVAESMQRFMALKAVIDLQEFLSGWFLGAESIPRDNIAEFVAYGFFCCEMDELSPDQAVAVETFVADVEREWGVVFEEGYDPSLRFMGHVWEPLRVAHKPLAVYAATEAAARVAHLLLRWMGFERGQQGAFVSWTSPGLAAAETAGAAAAPTPPMSPTVRDRAHTAAEHALDAAVADISAVAALVTQQYPHEGQQYHLPHPVRESESSVSLSALPVVSTFRGMMERRVALPAASPRRRRRLTTADSATSVRSDGPVPDSAAAAPPGGQDAGRTTDVQQTGVPVVFLHGVGFGTLPYLAFIRSLMKACPASPFVVLEVPHVALRLCRQAESVDDVAAAAVAAVAALRIKTGAAGSAGDTGGGDVVQACFVGHSYGSFVLSRIQQLYPHAVHAAAFLDPVCMLTCYPQLLYNFIYREFSLSTFFSSLAAAIDGVRFLCSRDLTIAQAFCRLFHWSELMVWPEDLPSAPHRALVVLSGRDDLVPGQLVARQFRAAGHPATVMYHPDLGHGGLLMDRAWSREVVDGVRRMVTRTGGTE